MEEATVTLKPLPGFDLEAYKQSLLARFANPALRHRTWQIAMDGSQKLPPRLVAISRDRLARGLPVGVAALGIAAWMRYVAGPDEAGRPIDLSDPMADRLKTLAAGAGGDVKRLAESLLGIEAIFGADLPADPRFTSEVVRHLDSLLRNGAERTAEAALA